MDSGARHCLQRFNLSRREVWEAPPSRERRSRTMKETLMWSSTSSYRRRSGDQVRPLRSSRTVARHLLRQGQGPPAADKTPIWGGPAPHQGRLIGLCVLCSCARGPASQPAPSGGCSGPFAGRGALVAIRPRRWAAARKTATRRRWKRPPLPPRTYRTTRAMQPMWPQRISYRPRARNGPGR